MFYAIQADRLAVKKVEAVAYTLAQVNAKRLF